MAKYLIASLRRLFSCYFLCCITCIATISYAGDNELPNGLSFAGLVDGEWHIYTSNNGTLRTFKGIQHPRTFSYHSGTGQIAFVGSDGNLRLRQADDSNSEKIITLKENSRYTQPSFSDDGKWLMAVELPKGKSRQTNIVGFDVVSGERHVFVQKRTAQFEPFMGSRRYLHYTTAICVDDCGGMIWELWRRDMQTGKQLQLTLMNAVSNQPHIRGNRIYFSSNAGSGRFHIWAMPDEPGSEPKQLTFGNVRDSDPTTDKAGDLYFLRKTVGNTSVMRMDDSETPVSLIGLEQFEDIRNLEISR